MFQFDSFGFTGLKVFIIQVDRKIVDRILYGIQKFKRKDNIETLISLKFSISSYRNLNHTKILELSSTLQTFEFRKVNNIKNDIAFYLVDDQLQESILVVSFTVLLQKLFDPLHNSKNLNDGQLTKDTVSKLLNKLFSL